MTRLFTRRSTAAVALTAALGLAVLPVVPASAAVSITGPIDLGSATSYGVLAASTVVNTGPSVITGDLGLSPGVSITGFPPGLVVGATNATNSAALQAQGDLTVAYNLAASLTPVQSGLTELSGLSLVPGVYSGPTLSLTGDLTLTGTAQSVWVFQAASALDIAPLSRIQVTGGANSCNVFWQVGSSATIGAGAQFVGTVMANQSITATAAATIAGRLLASTGAVTLGSNVITQPSNCNPVPPVVTVSPTITSPVPTAAATVGTPYSFTVTASGTPAATFAVTSGILPVGLSLNPTSGVIAGTPTTPGSFTFTVTAGNGAAPDASASYTITVAAGTGVPPGTVVPPGTAVPPGTVVPPGGVVPPGAVLPPGAAIPPVVSPAVPAAVAPVAAVVDAARQPRLATTGADVLPVAALSLVLIALGAALRVRSARTRAARP